MQIKTRSRKVLRQGAACVEFALVAPLFILFIFAILEFGRIMFVQQVLVQTSRDGARHAIINGSTIENTRDLVAGQLGDSAIAVDRNRITVAPDPATAAAGDQITVTVTVPYQDVNCLPGFTMFGGNIDLQSSTTMRRETSN